MEGAGTGRGATQCLLTYCVTKVLYDPASALEGMRPHESDEQGNILLLLTHGFSTYFIWPQGSFNTF